MNRLYFGDNRKWLSDQKSARPPRCPMSIRINPEADYDTVFRKPRAQISSTDSDIQGFGRSCDRRKAASKEKDAIAREALASTRDVCAARIAVHTKGRAWDPSFSVFCLDDYCNETSSIRKVVDNEKSVVQRNCSRIVCPM